MRHVDLLAHHQDTIYSATRPAMDFVVAAKAFPDGFPPPQPLTPAQRALLDLLAEHCFGPAAQPAMFADARAALSDLVPEGAKWSW